MKCFEILSLSSGRSTCGMKIFPCVSKFISCGISCYSNVLELQAVVLKMHH